MEKLIPITVRLCDVKDLILAFVSQTMVLINVNVPSDWMMRVMSLSLIGNHENVCFIVVKN